MSVVVVGHPRVSSQVDSSRGVDLTGIGNAEVVRRRAIRGLPFLGSRSSLSLGKGDGAEEARNFGS